MAEIPSTQPWLSRVFGKSAVYDFVLAPLAILGTSVAAYEQAWAGHAGRAWLLGAGAAIVFCAGVAKAVVTYRSQRVRLTHELEGCLHTLYAVLRAEWTDAVEPGLRITVHKPVDGGQSLEQILDYFGTARPDAARVGRRFPAQAGAAGRALRFKKALVGVRVGDNTEAFVDELIHDWSYTEADARRANTSVYSWMAVPLLERNEDDVDEVRGVVYLDAHVRDFFAGRREQIVLAGCAGIAQFIARR